MDCWIQHASTFVTADLTEQDEAQDITLVTQAFLHFHMQKIKEREWKMRGEFKLNCLT